MKSMEEGGSSNSYQEDLEKGNNEKDDIHIYEEDNYRPKYTKMTMIHEGDNLTSKRKIAQT